RPDPLGAALYVAGAAPARLCVLSLHDALPVCDLLRRLSGKFGHPRSIDACLGGASQLAVSCPLGRGFSSQITPQLQADCARSTRSEEHTSELQSRENLVCRLLLEKKNNASPMN